MKNKWKWFLVIVFGIFLIKNIVHYGIIVYQNQDFNQMFGFILGCIVFGYVYSLISKEFLKW